MRNAICYFLASHFWDYFITQLGLIFTNVEEGNAFPSFFMKHYGNIDGLLIYKFIMLIFLITSLLVIYKKYPRTAKVIINVGTLVTLIGSSMWLKYF